MDAMTVSHIMIHLLHNITDEIRDRDQLLLIGCNDRGYVLAKRMAELMHTKEHIWIPVCKMTNISCFENRKVAVLVTDLMATGKSACAAVYHTTLMHQFSKIFLATLIDVYNQRCLPLRADFVGKRMFVSEKEEITVGLYEMGEEEGVWRKMTK